MIHIQLTTAGRDAVSALRRDRSLSPSERDRVEMVLLSEQGWSVPQIASHLGYCHATVRRLFKQFSEQGSDALRHKSPGPPKDTVRAQQVQSALTTLLSQDRTWNASQLADALKEQGIHLSARQVRRYLRGIARWRRTVRTLKHKQDPEKLAHAQNTLATLKKKPPRGS
jgi:putative transposase